MCSIVLSLSPYLSKIASTSWPIRSRYVFNSMALMVCKRVHKGPHRFCQFFFNLKSWLLSFLESGQANAWLNLYLDYFVGVWGVVFILFFRPLFCQLISFPGMLQCDGIVSLSLRTETRSSLDFFQPRVSIFVGVLFLHDVTGFQCRLELRVGVA